jgi:hypothetical protein
MSYARPSVLPEWSTRVPELPEGKPRGFCWCGCGQTTRPAKKTDRYAGRVKGLPARYLPGHSEKRSVPAVDGPNPSGLCLCGCGQKTPLAKQSLRSRGDVAGRPVRYVRGHRGSGGPFWAEEDRGYETPCWVWQGAKDPKGYGRIADGNGGSDYAHRVYYEQRHGPIPKGMQLDHLCRVLPCVNPDHLEVVVPAENSRRGIRTKLTAGKVAEIRRLRAVSGLTYREIAERFGVGTSHVSKIVLRKVWKGTP